MVNNKNAVEWFQYATTDLKSAKFLMGMPELPVSIVCYHSQQSAEKYLKGVIAAHGGEIVKTHSLVYLLKLCSKYDKSYKKLIKDCVELNDYGVDVRYPSENKVNEEDVERALKSAEKIEKFVTRKIRI
ncbi:HEPN domain-containing protein [Bacillus paranthracis]|uniref:HEPN domain-containing protein n=1 Tax=Bacillus paranthracis TaxID=2026186 RepID=UPI00187900CB|nr:HEPN domain-containing protein [Bacillus paranthracis]MBE7114428.1 HEPN domain-containing protein [Bacillus paranthracis]MBE7154698.1 HEPN domain-containing protein [Bacillus paranthracis]